MLKRTRRLARALCNRDDPAVRDLDASIFRYDRCLLDIRKKYPPDSPLLWIENIGSALESALRHLKNTDPQSILSSNSLSLQKQQPQLLHNYNLTFGHKA